MLAQILACGGIQGAIGVQHRAVETPNQALRGSVRGSGERYGEERASHDEDGEEHVRQHLVLKPGRLVRYADMRGSEEVWKISRAQRVWTHAGPSGEGPS
eukprot:1739702-Amphidinium_carterae.3